MSRPRITVRYPFAPLAAVMGMGEPEACRVLGISGQTQTLYRREGMSELVADRMAKKAGFVSWEIWPEIIERAMDDTASDVKDATRRYHRRWRKRNRASCRRARARWRLANRDYLNFYQRQWRALNPERSRENDRRSWARRADQRNAERRERYANDPEYRERLLQAQRERDGQKRAMKEIARTKRKDDIVRYKSGGNTGYQTANDTLNNGQKSAPCHTFRTGASRNAVTEPADDAGSEQEVA